MASTMASGLLEQSFLRSFRRDPDLGVVPLQENTERERERDTFGRWADCFAYIRERRSVVNNDSSHSDLQDAMC